MDKQIASITPPSMDTPIFDSRVDQQPLTHDGLPRGLHASSMVYPCRLNDATVIMDLKSNKYVLLSGRQEELFWAVRDGSFATDADFDRSSHNVTSIVNDLIETNILSRDPIGENSIRTVQVSIDGNLISVGDEIWSDCQVLSRHWRAFLLSYLSARYSLRFRPLHEVVAQISRENTRLLSTEADPDQIVRLVSIFRSLRPYVFSAKGQCMLHALTLITFLLRFEVAASWVIGVRTKPWGAHTWIQHEKLLLDSNPEKVCTFTPILAV
jgi:hypothetical protein